MAYCILPLTECQVLNACVLVLVLVAEMCNWTGKDGGMLKTNCSFNLLCTRLRSLAMVHIKARGWLHIPSSALRTEKNSSEV